MHQVTVLFFATLKDMTGERKIIKQIPDGLKVSGLKKSLEIEYPSLTPLMNSVIVAMNHEFAFDETVISTNAEIALFPPVSGG